MAGKEPEFGPTARTVAENVQRLRETRGLNYKDLSTRVKTVAEWTISPVGIRKIEDGSRRVTPDDLMALAVALQVSPVDLLNPYTVDGHTVRREDTPVMATGLLEPVPASRLWALLTRAAPLDSYDVLQYQQALPWWQLYEERETPLPRATVKVERHGDR